jgi:hypothetical protein
MSMTENKNWCEDCQEFLVDYDQAMRCEDLNHRLVWRDPKPNGHRESEVRGGEHADNEANDEGPKQGTA